MPCGRLDDMLTTDPVPTYYILDIRLGGNLYGPKVRRRFVCSPSLRHVSSIIGISGQVDFSALREAGAEKRCQVARGPMGTGKCRPS